MTLDGNGVDMASAAVGMLLCLVRPCRRWWRGTKPYFNRNRLINDVLNGAMVVPFGVMMTAVFSQSLTTLLIGSAKFTLFLGGAVGLTFVIGELFKGKP